MRTFFVILSVSIVAILYSCKSTYKVSPSYYISNKRICGEPDMMVFILRNSVEWEHAIITMPFTKEYIYFRRYTQDGDTINFLYPTVEELPRSKKDKNKHCIEFYSDSIYLSDKEVKFEKGETINSMSNSAKLFFKHPRKYIYSNFLDSVFYDIKKDTTYTFSYIINKKGKRLYPLFTDKENKKFYLKKISFGKYLKLSSKLTNYHCF